MLQSSKFTEGISYPSPRVEKIHIPIKVHEELPKYESSLEYLVKGIKGIFKSKKKKMSESLTVSAQKLSKNVDFSKTYTTYSGYDIQVYLMQEGMLNKVFEKYPGLERKKELGMRRIDSCAGISYLCQKNAKTDEYCTCGTMIFSMFDRSNIDEYFKNDYYDVALIGMNEYGHASAMGIPSVRLVSVSSGVSVDDICIEEQVSFESDKKVEGWKKYNRKEKEE